ncbi:hypothetical protein [Kitasatospora sp. NPDC017646]|uniref:hypothetical protein n=1 Tax=Kitasatospora sp. NPDC017646 TaxID=3364024 RepID=UPI00379400E2
MPTAAGADVRRVGRPVRAVGFRRIRALFDLTRQDMATPGHRGCATLDTTNEFPDADHPANLTAVAHKSEVQSWLAE